MGQQPAKSRKKVSRRVIVFAVVALSPVILWGLLLVIMQLRYLPIRAEIARIASISGIKPLSIECRSGIDIGTVCDALYNRLTTDEQSKMLINSGYTIDIAPNDGSDYITATNSTVHIYASGGPSIGGKTNLSLQLNDYRN
jgi:hypothetical protein